MSAHLPAADHEHPQHRSGSNLTASLAGCVERGDWKRAAQLQPQALGAQQTLAGAKLDAAAWPADQWWRGYGDPQLDALIAEALAGSPSLEIAEATAAGRPGAGHRGGRRTGAGGGARCRDHTASDTRSMGCSRRPSPAATPLTLGWRSTSVSTWTSGAATAPCWRRPARGVQAADADRAAARLALAVGVGARLHPARPVVRAAGCRQRQPHTADRDSRADAAARQRGPGEHRARETVGRQ